MEILLACRFHTLPAAVRETQRARFNHKQTAAYIKRYEQMLQAPVTG